MGVIVMRTSNVLDPIHAELEPLVWDEPTSDKPVLKPVHAHWIKREIYDTLKFAGYTNIEDWLGLIFTGSLTTYQFSNDSDVDISLFVDTKVFPEWSRAEMIALMVDKLDGKTLPGTPFPLQDFVVGEGIKPSDLYKPGLRSGYDIDTGKWLVPPEKGRVHDVKAEQGGFYAWALQMADKMERLLRYEPEQAIKFWHSIHKKRQRDMVKGKGDFAESNIIYKMLANRGLFPQISGVSGEYIAKTASIEGGDLVERVSERHNYLRSMEEWNALPENERDPRNAPQEPEQGEVVDITEPGYVQVLWPNGNEYGEDQSQSERADGLTVVRRYIAKTAASDWFAPSYMLPDDAKQRIHEWAQTLPWPEGSRFAPPERYHVTGIYSPSGFADPSHQEWIQGHSGLTYPVQTVGVDNFSPSKVGEGAPVVLRVHHPQLEADTERLIDEAQQRGLPVSRFPGGYKPHITVGHSPTPIEADHPHLNFPVGPLRDLHGYYDELKRTASKAPEPPNYKASDGAKHCGNCKMYAHGQCWGYGNKKVKPDYVCDSWAQDMTSKTAARVLYNEFRPDPVHPKEKSGEPTLPFIYDPQSDIVHLGPAGAWHWQLINRIPELRAQYESDWDQPASNVAPEGHIHGNMEWPSRRVQFQSYADPEEAGNIRQALGAPEPEQPDDPGWQFEASNPVAHKIYDETMQSGGSTRDLYGTASTSRYGFAPDLATQTPIPLDQFSPQVVEDFIARFQDRLHEPGKFIGAWTHEGNVVLDVTEGHDDREEAYQRAWNGHQKSMWDNEANDEVPVRGLDYEQPLTTL